MNLALHMTKMKNPMIKNFNDPSEKGMFHSDLVREYYLYLVLKADYMSQKLCIHRSKDKKNFFINLDSEALSQQYDAFVKLLQQALAASKALEKALRNFKFPITQAVAIFITKDTVALYGLCQQAFDQIFERYFEMLIDTAQKCYDSLILFQAQIKPLKNLQEMIRHVAPSQQFPKLKEYPSEIVQNMQKYLQDKSDPQTAITPEDILKQKKLYQDMGIQRMEEPEQKQQEAIDMLNFIQDNTSIQQNQQATKQQFQLNDFDFFGESQQQQPSNQNVGMDFTPQVQPQQQISKTDLILNQFNQYPQQQSNYTTSFNQVQQGQMGGMEVMGLQNQQNSNPQMMQMMQMLQQMQQMQGMNNQYNPQYPQYMNNYMQNQNQQIFPVQFNTGMIQNMGLGQQMPGGMPSN